MHINDLATHDAPFVTIADLASYWDVSRKQIYRLIRSGRLPAVRFGPRILRVPRAEALELEESLRVGARGRSETPAAQDPAKPKAIALQLAHSRNKR